MNYSTAVDMLEEIGRHSVKNPISHTAALLERLGSPDRKVPAVHVAGTNGKGSVCACLESVLRESGLKTALFTSPHLQKIEERIRIDGKMITEERFGELFEKVLRAAEGMPSRPSYFEILYLMATLFFAEEKVDAAVIETGIGGRFDATSAGRNDLLAVITSISRDHISQLGGTVEEIASHKAGIIRAGRPCAAVYTPRAAEILRREAEEKGADIRFLDPETVTILPSKQNGEIDFCIPFRYDGHTVFSVRSEAAYQAENAAAALLALKMLREYYPDRFAKLSYREAESGLLSMRWAGRMEELYPRVFLDGAHNADGIRRFLESVGQILKRRRSGHAVLLFSAVRDKDSDEMIRELCAFDGWSKIVVTEITDRRKSGAETLASVFRSCGYSEVEECRDPEEAVRRSLQLQGTGELFICGSLYLIGEIRALLTEHRSAGEQTGENE